MKVVILLTVFRVLGPKHFDEAKRVATAIYEQSLTAQVPMDPLLMTAIVDVESGFDARAVNGDGKCVGLAQVRAGVSSKLSHEQLLDPRNNVREGVRILEEKLLQCGTLPGALAAYNSGSCDISDARERTAVGRRVLRYVRIVLTKYEHLQLQLTDYVQQQRPI